MALNGCCIWGCAKTPPLVLTTFHPANSRLGVNLKRVSAPEALTPIEDEKPVVESSGIRIQSSVLEGFHKYANLIRSEFLLKIYEISCRYIRLFNNL